ncbi:hypothetical protein DRI50_12230 [candidate division KSB1 bacterium]|nr:MAG: hypothetical protein DRI50_12230 [candidate division KSB1 bacterium]
MARPEKGAGLRRRPHLLIRAFFDRRQHADYLHGPSALWAGEPQGKLMTGRDRMLKKANARL